MVILVYTHLIYPVNNPDCKNWVTARRYDLWAYWADPANSICGGWCDLYYKERM
jgi:hypothetical protein